MLWLLSKFGENLFQKIKVITPTKNFFPDIYESNVAGLKKLTKLIASYMEVDDSKIDVQLFSDSNDSLKALLPLYKSEYKGASGLYKSSAESNKFIIAVNEREFNNQVNLIATIAHELGHVHLLGDNMLSSEEEDHEYMTDLLTVFFGMGIFTANSAFNFNQWQEANSMGWSSSIQGYLSERMFGYAHSVFTWIRSENNPQWGKFLDANVKVPFKQGVKYLNKGGDTMVYKLNVHAT